MQFEGNWTPVTDIVVDKVGKYAYVIGSPHDAAATPVVMDVVLDVRTKVPVSLPACQAGVEVQDMSHCPAERIEHVCGSCNSTPEAAKDDLLYYFF